MIMKLKDTNKALEMADSNRKYYQENPDQYFVDKYANAFDEEIRKELGEEEYRKTCLKEIKRKKALSRKIAIKNNIDFAIFVFEILFLLSLVGLFIWWCIK